MNDDSKLLKAEEAKNKTKGSAILILTALIWGLAFIAQRKGMDHIGAFTFSTVRCLIAGVCMITVLKLMKNRVVKSKTDINPKNEYLGGLLCGTALFLGMGFQQLGIDKTSIANSGFISALYIIIVPLLGLFFHKKVGINIWIGVILSLVGLGLLCFDNAVTMSKGDILILISAFFYSIHIMLIDYFSPKVDGAKMSCIQFFVAAVFHSIAMFILENPSLNGIMKATIPLLYMGILSTAVGYTLQIIGQKYVPPTIASLLLSLESVFGTFFGWLILKETLSHQKLTGCIFVFAAVILAQIPLDKLFKKHDKKV